MGALNPAATISPFQLTVHKQTILFTLHLKKLSGLSQFSGSDLNHLMWSLLCFVTCKENPSLAIQAKEMKKVGKLCFK